MPVNLQIIVSMANLVDVVRFLIQGAKNERSWVTVLRYHLDFRMHESIISNYR